MTTKKQIEELWQQEKEKWGLSAWALNFSNRKRSLGHCNCTKKVISISNSYLKTNPLPVMKDTLLHEIAHAIQFEKTGKTGHGREWKDLAREVGCKPKRCADLADINLPAPKYIGICSSCGNKTNFYRKVNKTYSCSKCSKKFDPRYVLKIVPA